MRRLTTAWSVPAVFALATLALGVGPLAAQAQDSRPAITKEQKDKGLKDAPAVAKAAGLSCQVSDAYFLGTSTGKDKGGIYEVACSQGLGYVLISGPKPSAFDCLAMRAQPAQSCRLPGNANPVDQLKPVVMQTGVACTVKDARYVGVSSTATVYEVSCQGAPGYLIEAPLASAPGAVQAVPCTAVQGAVQCTLTSKVETDAYIAGLATKSGKACQVSASRYVGSDKSGDVYYEVGCGQSPGFFVSADKTGTYKSVVTCAQGAGLGGCTLTNATQLATAQTATYTQQAKAAGFDCDVSKSRSIGFDPQRDEIVELACSNRPEGTVAVFPSAPGGRARFVDCVLAGQFGPSGACTFTTPTSVYAKYSAALAARNRGSCKVSGARYIGHAPSGTDFVETACTDGKPGWVLELNAGGAIQTLKSCGEAKAEGVGACQLPTNQKRG